MVFNWKTKMVSQNSNLFARGENFKNNLKSRKNIDQENTNMFLRKTLAEI